MSARTAWILAVWIGGMSTALLLLLTTRYVTDLSSFLPAHPTEMQRLLIEQLREGPSARTVMIAIQGSTPATRAALSRSMRAALRTDPALTGIDNGEAADADADRRFIFEHRYLLSDSVDAARFSTDGLRQALHSTLEELALPEGLWLAPLVPHDPTGETLEIIERLAAVRGPRTADGVWVSADGARALLLAETRTAGSDLDGAARALAAIRSAFDASVRARAAGAHGIELALSGPPVFAVAARTQIERAARRLALSGALLVLGILASVYRSATALLLGLVPVATGALAGLAAVALVFGVIHGTTLGFGSTLIGEAVDYSIYFFIASSGLALQAWRAHLWPTVRLGMLVSVCGFASLIPAGFPGLAQLGVYSVGGLLAAAAVTRFVLPLLRPKRLVIRDLAPFGRRCARLLARVHRLPRAALLGIVLTTAALALAVLALGRERLWSRDLASLSPIPPAAQNLDAELRRDLGAADVLDLVVVSGADLERALEGAERATRALDPLVRSGALGGADSPTDYLPSLAAQRARRASLPEADALRERLRQATAGLPIESGRLEPFIGDVETARRGALLTPPSLTGTSLASGFDALVLHAGDQWRALLPLHAADAARDAAGAAPGHAAGAAAQPSIDAARVRAALAAAGVSSAQVLDLKAESDALYGGYLRAALLASLLGLGAIALLIALARRSVGRAARVLLPLVLAVLLVAAGLSLCGGELTLMHLVGLLLIVAVGSNYALFFDRAAAAAEQGLPAPLTLAALTVANASTVTGFGLLSFSGVPVLTALGVTVAPGTLLALLLSAALMRPPRA